MYKTYQITWEITGKLEVRAKTEDEAIELVCNDYFPKYLIDKSIMLDVDVKNIYAFERYY